MTPTFSPPDMQHTGMLCFMCNSADCPAGLMFTGAAVISGGGGGNSGMLEGLIIEKLNGWDIEKRYAMLLI